MVKSCSEEARGTELRLLRDPSALAVRGSSVLGFGHQESCRWVQGSPSHPYTCLIPSKQAHSKTWVNSVPQNVHHKNPKSGILVCAPTGMALPQLPVPHFSLSQGAGPRFPSPCTAATAPMGLQKKKKVLRQKANFVFISGHPSTIAAGGGDSLGLGARVLLIHMQRI